jgi:O-antigen ligase
LAVREAGRLRAHLREHLALPHAIFIALVLLTDWQWLYREFYLVVLLAPFLIVLGREDWIRLTQSWVLRFCFAYLIIYGIAVWRTPGLPAREGAHFARHLLANFSFVALTAWLVWREGAHAARVCRWIAWAACLTALASLLVFYHAHPLYGRLTGWPWPNPNTAGAIFGLAAVAAAAVFEGTNHKTGARHVYLVLAAILAACTALAGSRAALAGMAASAAGCAGMMRARRPLYALLGASCALAVMAAMHGTDFGSWLRRADSGRLELWAHFWPLSWERPWLGFGIASGLKFTISNGLSTDDPHNMLLHTFLHSGMLGALTWTAVLVTALAAALSYGRRAENLLPLALMLYLVVHGIFESALPFDNVDWFWLYLWIPIGMAAGAELRLGRDSSGPAAVRASQ